MIKKIISSVLFFALLISVASALGSTYSSITYPQPTFSYGSAASTYWPALSNEEGVCKSRQDIILQVVPAGCQPVVVRSDLLAEQNVPVFCQISALQVNPLIDIKAIDSITFSGQYPSSVVGTGFHPAQAAIYSGSQLLGNPLINNIGYVVVVLKRQKNESALPDEVKLNLTARLRYNSYNSIGVGQASFVMPVMNDVQWGANVTAKTAQSFWQGRYFARVESADSNSAIVSIYYGDRKLSTTRVERGKQSNDIFVPGFSSCAAALKIAYDGFEASEDRAVLEISDEKGTDIFTAYGNSVSGSGTRFYNQKCYVERINFEKESSSYGSIDVVCNNQRFNLSLKQTVTQANGAKIDLSSGKLASNPYYQQALTDYKSVATKYPAETSSSERETYGEQALARAIELAGDKGAQDAASERELINFFISTYPSSIQTAGYKARLVSLEQTNFADSAYTTLVDTRAVTIRLMRLEKASKEKSIKVLVNNVLRQETTKEGSSIPISGGSVSVGKISGDSVSFSASCDNKNSNNKNNDFVIGTFPLREGGSAKPCGVQFTLQEINAEKLTSIRILPNVHNTETETNLSVVIGIEKRAIKLSPAKTKEMISNINDSIKKFESISKTLGNVVTGMKTACFATATYLTAKNLITGMDGAALARKKVMNNPGGWNELCLTAFKSKRAIDPKLTGDNKFVDTSSPYASISDCLSKNEKAIEADVANAKKIIQNINTATSQRDKTGDASGSFIKSNALLGNSVNSDKSAEATLNNLKTRYSGNTGITVEISDPKNKETKIPKTLEAFIVDVTKTSSLDSKGTQGDAWGKNAINYQNLQDVDYYAQIINSNDASEVTKDAARTGLTTIIQNVENNLNSFDVTQKNTEATGKFYRQPDSYGNTRTTAVGNYYGELYKTDSIANIDTNLIGKPFVEVTVGETYGLFLENPSGSDVYTIMQDDIYVINLVNGQPSATKASAEQVTKVKALFTSFKKVDASSCYNQYLNPEVSYFETSPYKGMPHIVPVNTITGWYAATEQVIGSLGQQTSYESSARVSSFWLCNVGENKRVDFDKIGRGDDNCRQFSINTGQPLNKFSCMSDTETQNLVDKAIYRITQAAQQHTDGLRRVSLDGESIPVGTPGVSTPSMQCESFMSASECKTLFQVCDPVICPTSRCNLGGYYQVPNVQQTGIIGSIALCWPNVREGIYMPVCLTGVAAGLDGFISLMKNHRDCLQESLNSGQMTGICDQVYSIYACEFFWNQVAPAAKLYLPKLVEKMYGAGQGAQGGGEYLTIMSSWQNAQQAMNYFTQTYAVNSIKAFQARSVEEFGDTFCKAFVSAKGVTSLKTLVEADSPPQFNAWFSTTKFTDATIPATSQYKVFYHIYSGKDSGVYYSVYLKNPPQTAYYSTAQQIYVASGFINKGEYSSETKDFTAPEGYQQLCVRINADEECGFGKVSTSFLVNYASDILVNNTLTQTGITSATSCVSGDASLSTVLSGALTGNLQSAAQGATNPQIYKQGIIRICATENPGKSTEPSRFVDVGYCDDSRTRCWIDMRSVNNSISQYDLGMKASSVTALTDVAKEALTSKGFITDTNDAKKALDDIGNAITAISTTDLKMATEAADKIKKEIDLLLSPDSTAQLYWGADRARALLLRGQANDAVARVDLINKKNAQPSSNARGTPASSAINTEEQDKKQMNDIVLRSLFLDATLYGKSFLDNYIKINKDSSIQITKGVYKSLLGDQDAYYISLNSQPIPIYVKEDPATTKETQLDVLFTTTASSSDFHVGLLTKHGTTWTLVINTAQADKTSLPSIYLLNNKILKL